MPLAKTEQIWHNGKFIHWDDAKIHVLSHVIHYGSAVFEGIRCYESAQGPAIFRLRDHMQRLLHSGHIYRMDSPYSLDDLCNAAVELVRVNKMTACYIRPITLRAYGEAGVDPRAARSIPIWLVGSGESISATKASARVSMFASVPGTVPHRTRCRKCPKPRRIT